MFEALLRFCFREYEQAEASAARALDLAEKHQIPQPTAFTRFVLGQARAQLGRTTEGIALIRQGIADLLEIGMRLTIPYLTSEMAVAQERGGAITDALEAAEQALQANPKEFFYRPEGPGFGANCGSKRDRQNWLRQIFARVSRSRKR
jgi:tetratricopeptide (TPR) repeat protein